MRYIFAVIFAILLTIGILTQIEGAGEKEPVLKYLRLAGGIQLFCSGAIGLLLVDIAHQLALQRNDKRRMRLILPGGKEGICIEEATPPPPLPLPPPRL